MTFSTPEVAAFVNAHFVAAWHNRAPGFKDLDYKAEENIFARSVDAYPTKNICTFFLTPKGEVLFYVAGYLEPGLFLETLELVTRLARASPAERRAIHAERASATYPPSTGRKLAYRGLVHEHADRCRSPWLFQKYIQAVHKRFSESETLAPLATVRHKYLCGNGFSEEDASAEPIGGEIVGARVFR